MGQFATFGKALKGIIKGTGTYAGRAFMGGIKTPGGLMNPTRAFGGLKKHSGAIIKGLSGDKLAAKEMAINSMRLLGTAAGVTYGVRALKGQSIFVNRRGKRDIMPWVPFV
jgi:hypothetical protein